MIAGDNDTDDKNFDGIIDTGEQLSPLTTTPAIKFFPGVVDTADKHSFANISMNFRKNLKQSQWHTQGPGVH
jgi:hypothetical protein